MTTVVFPASLQSSLQKPKSIPIKSQPLLQFPAANRHPWKKEKPSLSAGIFSSSKIEILLLFLFNSISRFMKYVSTISHLLQPRSSPHTRVFPSSLMMYFESKYKDLHVVTFIGSHNFKSFLYRSYMDFVTSAFFLPNLPRQSSSIPDLKKADLEVALFFIGDSGFTYDGFIWFEYVS